jgi:hypothetical protein
MALIFLQERFGPQIFISYLTYIPVSNPYTVIRKRVKSPLSRQTNIMKTSRGSRKASIYIYKSECMYVCIFRHNYFQ